LDIGFKKGWIFILALFYFVPVIALQKKLLTFMTIQYKPCKK